MQIIKGNSLQTTQTVEVFKCTVYIIIVIRDYYNVNATTYGTAANAVASAITEEFDGLHWCKPCDAEVSKTINTGLSSSSSRTYLGCTL